MVNLLKVKCMLVFAGFLGTKQLWEYFKSKWNCKLLRRQGIPWRRCDVIAIKSGHRAARPMSAKPG